MAERHAESAEWHVLPPAESKTANRRDLITGSFIRLRDTGTMGQGRCIRCGLRVKPCPASAFEYAEGKVVRVRYETCIDCGLCNAAHPVDAAKMPSLPDGYLADLIKTAPGPPKLICDYAFQDGDEEGVRVKCVAAVPKPSRRRQTRGGQGVLPPRRGVSAVARGREAGRRVAARRVRLRG